MFAYDAPHIVQKYLINSVFKKNGLAKCSKDDEEVKGCDKDLNDKGKKRNQKAEAKGQLPEIKIIS